MPLSGKKISSSQSLATISNVLLSAFVISALYFGRELLVPLALAALLTFLLSPLVTRIQRWVGKVPAVLAVVLLIFAIVGGIGWVVTNQAIDLANELPSYKENIRAKLQSIHLPAGDGPIVKVTKTIDDLKKDIPGSEGGAQHEGAPWAASQIVQPVKIVSDKDERLEFFQVVVAPMLGPLGMAALIILLLIFMLLQREDLRGRLIRLIGQGRISATTLAMDDAGSRVSKYLLMQLIVNVTYGFSVAIGLYFIGVPNAILWGTLSTVLRFIPYVGPWIAAAFPTLISFSVAPTWTAPILTISLFIVLELFSSNVMEPWLYGSSTGVTPIALIVAALVWTWLWGPVGLVLATPLTVCLVVMGRHIPRLSFLSILLSDEQALTPAEDCYHRLNRVGDHDEMELVDEYLKQNSTSALFDHVLIPVIVAAESDRRAGLLESDQLDFIESGLNDILEDLEVRQGAQPSVPRLPDELSYEVCCVPSRGYRDQLAGEMVVHLLHDFGIPASCSPSKLVSSEMVKWVQEADPDIVCISVVQPSTYANARYLCAKLRSSFPKLPLIVGMWGQAVSEETNELLRKAGADEIVYTVAQAAERIRTRAPMLIAVNPSENAKTELAS
jgi:predicted PurR-regulated permease PerM